MDFYNDNDRTACAWMRELMQARHVPEGVVDERSICDITGADLATYHNVHLFGGILGWPLALRLAGWDTTRPVWSGSCPCTPFSAAGKRKGAADSRHLWPDMLRLIRECMPSTIFGENVSSRLGREWFAGVRADLEALGYAVGGADLCASSAGAPHIRQRLFWVANLANVNRAERRADDGANLSGTRRGSTSSGGGSTPGIVAYDQGERRRAGRECESSRRTADAPDGLRDAGQLGDANKARRQGRPAGAAREADRWRGRSESQPHGHAGAAGDETGADMGALPVLRELLVQPALDARPRLPLPAHRGVGNFPLPASGDWDDFDIVHCTDGKARRVESGTFPLAAGLPGRVGLLRGYGNSIVPPLAAIFIRCFLEAETQGA